MKKDKNTIEIEIACSDYKVLEDIQVVVSVFNAFPDFAKKKFHKLRLECCNFVAKEIEKDECNSKCN